MTEQKIEALVDKHLLENPCPKDVDQDDIRRSLILLLKQYEQTKSAEQHQ